MYIPGVTKVADLPNDVETKEHYRAEQKQRYYERVTGWNYIFSFVSFKTNVLS